MLSFASGDAVRDGRWRADVEASGLGGLPHIGCSTAGEIRGTEVSDGTAVVCSVELARSRVRVASAILQGNGDEAGRDVAAALRADDLKHVLVFADGLRTNGSALALALQAGLPPHVTVSGGLAGDQERFAQTHVWAQGPPQADAVVALGLYGEALRVGFGSQGGWRPFGPERRITRSEGNRLFALDDRTALALYREYLGDLADQLPAAGLRFPLSLRLPANDRRLVRTVLSVDPADGSMVFAGDVPTGSYARLMHAGNDGLISGAERAAEQCRPADARSELALLISCVGRRLVLDQESDAELDAVAEVFGGATTQVGFYSYGELCPRKPDLQCDLHNQTMTITTLREAV